MPIRTLDHCSIRTVKIDESRSFYVDMLGMDEGDRPDFPFPGHWLYVDGHAVVHLVGVDRDDTSGLEEYLGGEVDTDVLDGSGSFDHIAFCATDESAMLERLKQANFPFKERRVPNIDLYQIFVEDPNGITIELNYFDVDR
ncbi:MAG: VOC family protein [Candidatus Rariloculaceae bacterium]